MALGCTVESMLTRYVEQVPDTAATRVSMAAFLAEAVSLVEEALYPVAYATYGSAAARDVPIARPTQWLALPAHQAGSVTTVLRVIHKGDSSETTETYTDAVESADGHFLYRDEGWAAGEWARVTAVWGYGPAPEAINRIAYEVAITLWRGREAGLYTTLGTDEGARMVYTGGLNASHRAVIETAKRRWRPRGVTG